MLRLKEALPRARFVGAAAIMGEARFVKSAEEIAFLRKAVTIAERSLYAMLEVAAAGVFEPG